MRESARKLENRDLLIAGLLILLGISVRLWLLICDRSFWCDEAMLAMNIAQRKMAGLLWPLDWNQAAPVAFLLASKMVANVAGVSEVSLRILPFLSGVGCLFLGAWLALWYLGREAAVAAIALLAASDKLIYFSNEFKPYEGDAFLFLLFVTSMLAAYESRWARTAMSAMIAIGVLGIFFSYTIVFAMAGFFPAAWILGFRDMRRLALCALVWGAAFILDYGFFLHGIAHNDYLHNWWKSGFPPGAILSTSTAFWLIHALYAAAAYSLGGVTARAASVLLAICVVVGLTRLWRGPRQLALFLWFPVLFAIAASLVRAYPFDGRLITFTIPGFLITGAAAVDIPARWPGAAACRWALVVGLCLFPVISAAARLTTRDQRQELRPVLEAIKPSLQPNDTLYVYSDAWAAFQYYRYIWFRPDVIAVPSVDCGQHLQLLDRDLEKMRGRDRVWFVVTNVTQTTDHGEIAQRFQIADQHGKELERYSAFDAQAVLYDMR